MQGSHSGHSLHDQGYRVHLKSLIESQCEGAHVYDPLAEHQDSVAYDHERGEEVFFHHNRLCRQVDVVVAFVPQASMGTAIEMWEPREHGGAAVIAISPLQHNWTVRFCSHATYPSIESFEAALRRGEIARCIRQVLSQRDDRA